jgi:site-specific recombinase XerD
MAHNTVLSHFKRFKAVFGWALDRKLIDQNPVGAMKLGEWQTKKSYLSLADLEKLHRCLPNFTTEQTTIGRLFLFACYTGLRFSDTMQLQPCAVVETVNGVALNYVQHKTKKQELLPLLPQAVALLPHVYGQSFTNQYFNRVLKDIAKAAGITSVLVTAHVARHTFATIALNKGTRLEVVQSLLGHSNIKTTQGYANLFEATKFEGLALWNK